MAWYWPDLDTPQSAKTAVVNTVGVSALLAVWTLSAALQLLALPPSRRTGRLWLSLAIAVIFALIGWGIRRMSRAVAIVGVVWWLGWLRFLILPGLISAIFRGSYRFAVFWLALDLLVLLLYVIAVRATFAYHRHLTSLIR